MNDSINLEQNALLTQKAHEILSQRFNLKTSIKQLDKSSLIQVGEHYLALIHNERFTVAHQKNNQYGVMKSQFTPLNQVEPI